MNHEEKAKKCKTSMKAFKLHLLSWLKRLFKGTMAYLAVKTSHFFRFVVWVSRWKLSWNIIEAFGTWGKSFISCNFLIENQIWCIIAWIFIPWDVFSSLWHFRIQFWKFSHRETKFLHFWRKPFRNFFRTRNSWGHHDWLDLSCDQGDFWNFVLGQSYGLFSWQRRPSTG